MLVGATLVDGSKAREVDAAVGAGDAGLVETTDVNGGDDASVLEANPIGTMVSSVEVALERLADALLSAVADTAVASEVIVVEASLEAAEDVEGLTSEVAVAVIDSLPEDKSRVVPLDNGIDVEMPIAAEVVIVALFGKKEGTLDACETDADAARDDSAADIEAETEEAIDDWTEEMDERRDDGGVVTGTGITSVPEVEAVNEVIEGETPVGATELDTAVPLLTTILSADEIALSVAADEVALSVAADAVAVLSIAVAEVRLVSTADAAVLFAGTEMRVPGVAVVSASLVAVPKTSLVASDAVAEVVAETSPDRSVAVVLPRVDCKGTVALSVVFALSVAEAVICVVAEVSMIEAVLSVAVTVGIELESVIEPGRASVVFSAAVVEVAEASVTVAEAVVPDASEAEALERRLEKSEASEDEIALSEAVATMLERSEAMPDKTPPKRPVVVGPSDEVFVASVVSAEAKEEILVSRAACADETMLDKISAVPVAPALETPPSEVVIPMGNGIMGVVLSVEAVPVDKVSAESPVVVAKRGRRGAEEVATTVALLASAWSATAVSVPDSLAVVAEAGAAVEVVEEPPFKKVERPTMMPPPVFDSVERDPLVDEAVGRMTISGIPPVDAALLSCVIAVGCTSSVDETATPVEAPEV